MRETWVRSLGWEDPLEKDMATHSSILAWRIHWTEEPGRLQSMSRRVAQNWMIFTSISISHWRLKSILFLWYNLGGNRTLNNPFCNSPSSFSGHIVYCSVSKLCLTLCGPMDCSMPGCPSLYRRIHRNSCPLSQWCFLTTSPSVSHFLFCLQSFPDQDIFQWVRSSHQVAKVLELQHQTFQWVFRVGFL